MNIDLIVEDSVSPQVINDILKNTVDTEGCILELLEFSEAIREFKSLMK